MKAGFWTTVRGIIGKADVVLFVLDARFPNITRVTNLEQFAKKSGKKVVLIINKVDLLSKDTLKKVEHEYKNQDSILLSTKERTNISELIKKINEVSRKDRKKVAIIGYPNTGKSSLINVLSGGGRVRTSSESGYTKGKQLIAGRLGMVLMDTPGVVPYEQRDEVRLGLVSGISPSKLENPDVVAFKLLEIFHRNNQKAIEDTYGIEFKELDDEVLEVIALKLKFLLKGNLPDPRRAAIKVLEDWHLGKIKL